MNSKVSVLKSQNLDNTKLTSMLGYKSGELSDMTRAYRREQMIKKKLKIILETNANLQRQIKTYENQIRDERGSINFQLNELIREMIFKFTNFSQEKLERDRFQNNEKSHKSIQEMMAKYQIIQKQSKMLKKTFDTLSQIHTNYQTHEAYMQALVVTMEQHSKQYELKMDDLLSDVNDQIKEVTQQNLDIEMDTQRMLKQLDQFDGEVLLLKEEEAKIKAKIEKLKKVAGKQQKKVDEIKEWAEIVIDKNNRKQVYQLTKSKEAYLQTLQNRNRQLEIYFFELQAEEKQLIKKNSQKQNIFTSKSLSKNKKCLKKKERNGK